MVNFYLDILEFKYYLNYLLMKRIVELKECNYVDKDKFDYVLVDFEDVMDSYDKVLEIVGEICGDIIVFNVEGVDYEGLVCVDNCVIYVSGIIWNLDVCCKVGLMGMVMFCCFGGLNFLIILYIMVVDIVSCSDVGFENLWGLQDCVEIIYEFVNEEQK